MNKEKILKQNGANNDVQTVTFRHDEIDDSEDYKQIPLEEGVKMEKDFGNIVQLHKCAVDWTEYKKFLL